MGLSTEWAIFKSESIAWDVEIDLMLIEEILNRDLRPVELGLVDKELSLSKHKGKGLGLVKLFNYSEEQG